MKKMTAKLKDQSGVLMIIFIIAMVMSSMVITTAFYEINRVIQRQRRVKTQEQMAHVMRGLGKDPFLVANEGGEDIDYISENNAFPDGSSSGLADFVNDGYLDNFGFSSGAMAPGKDAFGNDLVFADGGTFSVKSTGGSGPDITGVTYNPDGSYDTSTTEMVEANYNSINVVIEFWDQDGDTVLTSADFEPSGGGPYPKLVAEDGTTDYFLTDLTPMGDGRFENPSVPAGKYAIFIKLSEVPSTSTPFLRTFCSMSGPIVVFTSIEPEAGGGINDKVRIPCVL